MLLNGILLVTQSVSSQSLKTHHLILVIRQYILLSGNTLNFINNYCLDHWKDLLIIYLNITIGTQIDMRDTDKKMKE